MYFWDGASWVSTRSPDGQFRWNGAAWTPIAPYAPVPYAAPRKPPRQPTSWTPPLSYTVLGWTVLAATYRLTLPLSMNGFINAYVNRTVQQQRDMYGTVPPPGYADTLTTLMTVGIWIGVAFWIAISVVLIVGALKRWIWSFYGSLVMLALSVIFLPAGLISITTVRGLSNIAALGVPTWSYWWSIGLAVSGTALFGVMVTALIRRGPWAMRRVS